MEMMTVLVALLTLIVGGGVGATVGWVLGVKNGTKRELSVPKNTEELIKAREELASAVSAQRALKEQLDYEHSQSAEERQLRRKEMLEAQTLREKEQQAESKVLQKLAPVDDVLKKMQAKIEALEGERKVQYTSLNEAIKMSHINQQELQKMTGTLSNALRSNQSRGQWGETQLRTIVEATGMLGHVDFDTQVVSGANRPDMVIHLPGKRSIVIDSKVPADKFLDASAISEYTSAEENAKRKDLLIQHAKAVRIQVDNLAKKEYWTMYDDEPLPDFTIMFIPSEAMLSSALEVDPNLLEYAFSKRVALASPVSLFSVLKTVSFVWQQQALSENAAELGEDAKELISRVKVLAKHSANLGDSIEKTISHYNKFATSLQSNVLTQANRMAQRIEVPAVDDAKQILNASAEKYVKPELTVGTS